MKTPVAGTRSLLLSEIRPSTKLDPDEAYLLKDLKKTPLTYLFTDWFFCDSLRSDVTAISHGKMQDPLYPDYESLGDAINLIYEAISYSKQDSALSDKVERILRDIASVLASSTDVRTLRVLDLPVLHFFQLAEHESGCSYPMFIYQHHIASNVRETDTLRELLMKPNSFTDLFYLLVDPLYHQIPNM